MDSRGSTLARLKLLTSALQGDKHIPLSLVKACRSQGGLAKYICRSEGIEPMALNTLKSCADQFVEDGGWGKLDSMRKSYLSTAKDKGDQAFTRSKRTARQKDLLIELQNTLDLERRYRIRIQVAYEALLERIRIMAKTDPELVTFINRHTSVFSFKRIALADKSSDLYEN